MQSRNDIIARRRASCRTREQRGALIPRSGHRARLESDIGHGLAPFTLRRRRNRPDCPVSLGLSRAESVACQDDHQLCGHLMPNANAPAGPRLDLGQRPAASSAGSEIEYFMTPDRAVLAKARRPPRDKACGEPPLGRRRHHQPKNVFCEISSDRLQSGRLYSVGGQQRPRIGTSMPEAGAAYLIRSAPSHATHGRPCPTPGASDRGSIRSRASRRAISRPNSIPCKTLSRNRSACSRAAPTWTTTGPRNVQTRP